MWKMYGLSVSRSMAIAQKYCPRSNPLKFTLKRAKGKDLPVVVAAALVVNKDHRVRMGRGAVLVDYTTISKQNIPFLEKF